MTPRENRDELIREFVGKLESEPHVWEKTWRGKSYMAKSGATGQPYRGLNSVLLTFTQADKGYDDNRWYTFLEAKKKNAFVKKGEKGTSAFFYREYDILTKEDFDPETVKGMTNKEKWEYKKENVKLVLNRFTVFNACQIEGIPKEEHKPLMTAEEQRANSIAQAEHIIAKQPCAIIYGGNQAYYSPLHDNIHLPEITDFKSMQDYYATALHEIAHSTGHSSRLNRLTAERMNESDYAMEELRAEMSAVFVQNDLDIKIEGEHFENHLAYVQAWAKRVKENPQAFVDAIKDATEIADYIESNYAAQYKGVDLGKSYNTVEQARTAAQELVRDMGKSVVVIEWSEHPKINGCSLMSFPLANKKLTELNEQEKGNLGYYKTKLHIAYPTKNGEVGEYNDCRFDIGSETRGLVEHVSEMADYFQSAEDRQGVKELANTLAMECIIDAEKQIKGKAPSPQLQALRAAVKKQPKFYGASNQASMENVEE